MDWTQIVKFDQIKTNLKSCDSKYWLFFFFIIPFLLLLVYALPQSIKDDFFIFKTLELLHFQTYITNGYTHSEFYPHMITNIFIYVCAILTILIFEFNKRRLIITAAIFLISVPIISSLCTTGLWHYLGKETILQGFSGISAAFLAYAFIVGITCILNQYLEEFDLSDFFDNPKNRPYFSVVLIFFMLSVIVCLGVKLGQFEFTTNSLYNGLVHFSGFITGLIVFLLYDIISEKRKTFDILLGLAIIVGFLIYCPVILDFIRLIKGY